MSFVDVDKLTARAINKGYDWAFELIALVQEIPEADVVQATRCGQCLAWDKESKTCAHSGRIQVGENSYCDRGITKEDLKL